MIIVFFGRKINTFFEKRVNLAEKPPPGPPQAAPKPEKEGPAMKRSSLIYGFNPHALCSVGKEFVPVCITPKELGRMGIPARKVERVMQELSALAQADPSLDTKPTMAALARQIAAQLL